MKIKDLYPDVISEDLNYEYKAVLNPDNPIKWAKTIIGYANDKGGTMFVGVSNDGEAFGIGLGEIDKTKLLISRINDRNIFPHVKITYMMRSVDDNAERFVLAVKVAPAESVIRYREGDYNETVYVKGDGNATPATPEEIISLSKRKYGVDNETSEIEYCVKYWTEYIDLCKRYRQDQSVPSVKELQNEEIVSKDGYAKSGFIMFSDDYDRDDTMICCRLWKGKNKTGVVLDSSRLRGSLARVFVDALNFIERNTKTGWHKTENGGREEVRSYPKEAIREALVNAIAHRDYSIAGTQIDVDIYSDRIEIVSPGSWLLPKDYYEYPLGSIPSIRRNSIIAACLDVANLMERGGTGFQTMIEAYKKSPEKIQPVISIYPGFLNLRLYDMLYSEEVIELDLEGLSNAEKVISILNMEGSKSVKELQERINYRSRSQFLKDVINPLIESGDIYRDGKPKSPTSRIKIKK
ncbi:MAG: ATP-binding protein [Lachnospiraceae bacterium]|nr:ATP-binding protein [Lachnospiraceae bacterium]MDY3729024.1 ATP-binding protein [Candidatus Choladocola sp.]